METHSAQRRPLATRRWGVAVRAPELRARAWWGDVALAAGLLVFGLVGTGTATAEEGWAGPPMVSGLLVTFACLPLVAWRWRPLWTFAATSLAVMLYLAMGTPHGPILVAGLVAVYGVTSRCRTREAVIALAGLLVAAVVAAVARVMVGGSWTDVASVVVIMGAPAAAGVAVRVRDEAEEELRRARSQRRAMEQRLHMAREIHDVVGHGLTVISLQAGVALHLLDEDQSRARAALEAIRAASREALDGLRAELDAMRGDDADPAPRRPAGDLGGLVKRIRGSGLAVRLEGDIAETDLPQEVEVAVYRIVQESLTNVLRHAGPAVTVRIGLRCTPDAVLLRIVDSGPGVAGTLVAGRGIPGMRARAQALGGELDAGPAQDGGFAVHARIPTRPVPS